MFAKNEIIESSNQREGTAVNIVGDDVTIWISYLDLSLEEIENFNTCPIEIGVGVSLDALVFAFKLGNLDWQDLLYSYHYSYLQYQLGRDIFVEPSIEHLRKDEPLLLKVYLFDADKKEVVGKRVLALPDNLKAKVIEGLMIQKYSKVPILNTVSAPIKIQSFEYSKEFLESQPVEAIVRGLEKHTFNC